MSGREVLAEIFSAEKRKRDELKAQQKVATESPLAARINALEARLACAEAARSE